MCSSAMFISMFISNVHQNCSSAYISAITEHLSKPLLSECVFISLIHQPVHQQCSSKLFISQYLSQYSKHFNQNWKLSSSKPLIIKHDYIKRVHQLYSPPIFISTVHQPKSQSKFTQSLPNLRLKLFKYNIKWKCFPQPCSLASPSAMFISLYLSQNSTHFNQTWNSSSFEPLLI